MHNSSVYKPTTTSPETKGYLDEHSSRGCCHGGRKKRLQFMLVLGAVVAVLSGVALLVLAATAAAGGAAAALLVLLGVTLLAAGGGLGVLYLRAVGRCNLPFWPSRAARLSRTLIEENPPRSTTQMTLAEEEFNYKTRDERAKLMESDSIEADKIAESEPKVVLMDSTREC